MNPNELTPYGEALEKIIELQDLLIEEQKEGLRLMGEVEKLKDKYHCCPDCGCHFVGEYSFNYEVKELTDEEIHQAIRRGFSRDGFLSDGIFLEIKEVLRKASEK